MTWDHVASWLLVFVSCELVARGLRDLGASWKLEWGVFLCLSTLMFCAIYGSDAVARIAEASDR